MFKDKRRRRMAFLNLPILLNKYSNCTSRLRPIALSQRNKDRYFASESLNQFINFSEYIEASTYGIEPNRILAIGVNGRPSKLVYAAKPQAFY